MARPNWSGTSSDGKIKMILMQFNYPAFGRSLIGSALRMIDSSLPSNIKLMLADFLLKLNSSVPLNLKQAAAQVTTSCHHDFNLPQFDMLLCYSVNIFIDWSVVPD